MLKRFVSLVALMALTSGLAQAKSVAFAPAASPESDGRTAITPIVRSAVTEVKLCSFAMEKTARADVRFLCRKAATDNARVAITGMQLAQKLGVTDAKFEASPSADAQIDSLSQLSGPDFERRFLLDQIDAAENDMNIVRYAIEVTTNSAVKRFELAVLSSVEDRLNLAESALRRLSEQTP
jgi:predicted outer membrane protein